MAYNMISELTSEKKYWKIKARVLRIWEFKQNINDVDSFGLDMLLIDEKGNTIQGTIWKADIPYFRDILQKNEIYTISGFRVTPPKKSHRCSEHSNAIQVARNTFVRHIPNCQDPIPFEKFQFVKYESLRERVDQDLYLTDYVGELITMSHSTNTYTKKQMTKKRDLRIRDERKNEIMVTLWRTTADNFNEDFIISEQKKGPVVIVIAAVAVRIYGGDLTLSACSATTYYVNLDIPEVVQLKNMYKLNLIVKDDNGSTFLLVFRKIVEELIGLPIQLLLPQMINEQHEQQTLFPRALQNIIGMTKIFQMIITR
ncbi:uncharacterized protein LOC126682791 [Mercurialis annua]|uniref:uncharacterized protein LOC126682791 n=1 Tax=Mercurialis annua TaxID=3986 RepID=UPI0021604C91|nr:uncharacterized protein LOC126682791 [Mercurialis annua]